MRLFGLAGVRGRLAREAKIMPVPEITIAGDGAGWEADWVRRHVEEAPDTVGAFLAGDGISLAGTNVMDIGSGDGLIDWGVMTRLGPQSLTGFDLDVPDTAALLRRLQAQGLAQNGLPEGLSFKRCTVDHIPAGNQSFDVAISWSAFEHIHDPVTVVREVRRVLKREGIFMVQVYPFFLSEHGSHLEKRFPEGFAHSRTLEELALALTPAFTETRQISAVKLTHSRHGNEAAGDQLLWEYLNLSRITLDDLQRALLQGGFWISKVEAIAPAIHLPRSQNFRSLADVLIAGIKLIAVPND